MWTVILFSWLGCSNCNIMSACKYDHILHSAFPALALHEFSFSPGALTFHPLLHPLWYTFHSFHPSQCIFSSTICHFLLPPSIVDSYSSPVPLIHRLPASSALSFYDHDNEVLRKAHWLCTQLLWCLTHYDKVCDKVVTVIWVCFCVRSCLCVSLQWLLRGERGQARWRNPLLSDGASGWDEGLDGP